VGLQAGELRCFRIRRGRGEWGTEASESGAEGEEAGTAVDVADRLAGPDDIYCGA